MTWTSAFVNHRNPHSFRDASISGPTYAANSTPTKGRDDAHWDLRNVGETSTLVNILYKTPLLALAVPMTVAAVSYIPFRLQNIPYTKPHCCRSLLGAYRASVVESNVRAA